MGSTRKVVVVTGASQGIGAGIARAFIARGYGVVATSRDATSSRELQPGAQLALVDGDIGSPETARQVIATAVDRFGSVDAVVANAGIFIAKPFTAYTADDLAALVATNVAGFVHVTQLGVAQMLRQGSPGSVVTISASLVQNPIAGVPVSLSMITKGGLEAATRSLAIEYAKERIRFNAVAPGIVDTPMHAGESRDALRALSPMGTIPTVDDIASAVVYLTEAQQITGEVLHVDGGAHRGKW